MEQNQLYSDVTPEQGTIPESNTLKPVAAVTLLWSITCGNGQTEEKIEGKNEFLTITIMKKIAMTILFLYTYTFSFAQDKGNASTAQLLTAYYNLKDALVAGNTNAAIAGAGEFIKKLNAVDKDIIKEEDRNTLIKEGAAIFKTNNLNLQRERFAILSVDMIALAKKVKLATGPVYQQYCPMKKSSWLSNNKTIKNPYYGSAMLTCGSVVEAL